MTRTEGHNVDFCKVLYGNKNFITFIKAYLCGRNGIDILTLTIIHK